MKWVFWGSLILIVYPYGIYLPLLVLWAAVRPRPVGRAPIEPTVTVLIPAYNEVAVIGATLDSILAQDYPSGKLQIVVVSDASADGTDTVVESYGESGVTLHRQAQRGGKALGLNAGVCIARGEIIVFCDANARFAPDAVRQLVQSFADCDVGYVTGALTLESDMPGGAASAGSAYLNFEGRLRAAETLVGSVIGVNGGCDAMRRALYTDVPRELISDFVLPLRVIAGGHRVVYDPSAMSREKANTELRSEFGMRVRVALRALQGMLHMRQLLDPLHFPAVSFCLVSHKVLRYFAFVFLVTALAANLALAATSSFYQVLLLLHLLAYAMAGCSIAGVGLGRLNRLAVVPGYLLMSYVAFAVASWRLIRGQSMATWKPRAG